MSMDEVFAESFGGISIPRDAYAIAINAAQEAGVDEQILHANGLHVAMQFPPYFSSVVAMESGVSQLFQHLRPFLPRIKFWTEQQGLVPPVLAGAFDSRRARYGVANVEWAMDAEARAFEERVIPFTYPASFTKPIPVVLSQLMVSNLNQYHRRQQELFQLDGLRMLEELCDVLDKWCAMAGFRWALRPPIAQTGNKEESLLSFSPLRGLQDESPYLTASNAAAKEWFNSRNLYGRLFASITADEQNPYDHPTTRLRDYRWWMDSCYFGAIASDRFPGFYLGLMPVGLPPQLVMPCRDTIPFFVTSQIRGSLVTDQLFGVKTLSPSELREGAYLLDSTKVLSTPSARAAARILAAIAAISTAVIAPESWGRGNRKPAWMTSPPNATLLMHLRVTVPYLITNLTRLMDAAS